MQIAWKEATGEIGLTNSKGATRNVVLNEESPTPHRRLPLVDTLALLRGLAQFGSASALGAEGRRFKSCISDVLD